MGATNLKQMIVAAMFAAIIAVSAQIMINIPPVPFTLLTIAVMLTGTILPIRYTMLAVLLYLAMGLVGVPVFAGMKAGPAVMVGPTGGYLMGLLPAALFISTYLQFFKYSKLHAIIANCLGALIILIVGAVWLKFIGNLSWDAALRSGLLLFVIPDLLKAIAAAFIGLTIRRRLKSLKMM